MEHCPEGSAQYSWKMQTNILIALITFIVFQGEVGINGQLARQSEGKPLSVGKVILIHCRDSLDNLLFTGHRELATKGTTCNIHYTPRRLESLFIWIACWSGSWCHFWGMSRDLLIVIGSSDLQGGILSCFLLYSRLVAWIPAMLEFQNMSPAPGEGKCWHLTTTGALRGQPRCHLCPLVTLNWSDTQWAPGESWTWEEKELIASAASVLIVTVGFGVLLCSSHKALSLTVQHQDVLKSLGVFKWISAPQQENLCEQTLIQIYYQL